MRADRGIGRALRPLVLILGLLPAFAFGQGAADKRASLDKLLDALKSAPSEAAAGQLEDRVQQMWLQAGTPAVSLLMSRGLRELKAGAADEAIAIFTDAITLDPTLAEAFHQRAIARFHAGDTPGAIHDLEETLKREPRDFGAFRTLAEIAAAREDWRSAYAAWEKVLQLSPKTPGGEERLKDLKRRAFGQET
jgi:tetratricopeptide (TPR) repeat protein